MTVGTAASTKKWHLPKELLTNSSPFFAAALDGSFAEATSKVVHLPKDSTDAFALFIRWLYVGEIAATECSASHDHDHDHLCIAATFQTLVQAWMLGDKLGCPIFKDLAMLDLIKILDLGVITPTLCALSMKDLLLVLTFVKFFWTKSVTMLGPIDLGTVRMSGLFLPETALTLERT